MSGDIAAWTAPGCFGSSGGPGAKRLRALACCWVGAAAASQVWQGPTRLGSCAFAHGPSYGYGGSEGTTRRLRSTPTGGAASMTTSAPPRRPRVSVPMSHALSSKANTAVLSSKNLAASNRARTRARSSIGGAGAASAAAPSGVAAVGAVAATAGGGSGAVAGASGGTGRDLPFFDYAHLGVDGPKAHQKRPDVHMFEALGRAKLLTASEERRLGRKIQVLMEYEETRDTLLVALGRAPTAVEWARAVGEASVDGLRATLLECTTAKHIMVRANMRLVIAIAKRYSRGGVGLQDLIQEGSLGLIRAAEKYDPERGFKFSTYAAWWIQQAIFKAIAYHSRLIRLPVHVHNLLNNAKRARRELVGKLGRAPSEAEVADHLDIPVDKLRRYVRASRNTISTEIPTGRTFGAGAQQEWVLGDTLESKDTMAPEESAEMRLFRNSLQQIMQDLPDEERRVVTLRYGLDDGRFKSLQEIAELSRCSKDWVRKTETRALRKLRSPQHQERLLQFTETVRTGPPSAQQAVDDTATVARV